MPYVTIHVDAYADYYAYAAADAMLIFSAYALMMIDAAARRLFISCRCRFIFADVDFIDAAFHCCHC